jgi:hypothetical protein
MPYLFLLWLWFANTQTEMLLIVVLWCLYETRERR